MVEIVLSSHDQDLAIQTTKWHKQTRKWTGMVWDLPEGCCRLGGTWCQEIAPYLLPDGERYQALFQIYRSLGGRDLTEQRQWLHENYLEMDGVEGDLRIDLDRLHQVLNSYGLGDTEIVIYGLAPMALPLKLAEISDPKHRGTVLELGTLVPKEDSKSHNKDTCPMLTVECQQGI
jgi:hypothetical protein